MVQCAMVTADSYMIWISHNVRLLICTIMAKTPNTNFPHCQPVSELMIPFFTHLYGTCSKPKAVSTTIKLHFFNMDPNSGASTS